MNIEVAKQLLIILSLFLIILFTISMLFYDCFPFSEDRVKSIEYQADEKVKTIVGEVESKSITNDETKQNEILKTYEVDKSDLIINTGEEYEAGKKKPFSEVSEPVKEVVTTQVVEGESIKANSSNPVENTGTFLKIKIRSSKGE